MARSGRNRRAGFNRLNILKTQVKELGPRCGACDRVTGSGRMLVEEDGVDGEYYCHQDEPVFGGTCWELRITKDFPELREWLFLSWDEDV